MTFLKNTFKLVLEVIYIILGVILTNYLTLIYWLSKYTVSDSPSEQTYPIDLAINILIVKGIFFGVYYLYIFLQSSHIILNFTDSSGKYTKTESYSFTEDVTTIYVKIHIDGRLKKLKKDKIILNLPPGVTASKGKNEDIKYEITGNDNIIEIPLKNIQSSKVQLDEEFYLDFKLIKSRDSINSSIELLFTPRFKLTRKIITNIPYLR